MAPSACRFGCNDSPTADQVHCFFECILTREVGQWLLLIISRSKPTSEVNILKMDIPDDDALIWITATTLHFCWNKRSSKSKADILSCLAYLTAKSKMFEETMYGGLVDRIKAIINQEDEEIVAQHIQ